MTPRLLTQREVAELLGVTPRWVKDRRISGRFPATHYVGRSPRYTEAAVRDLLDSLRHNPPQDPEPVGTCRRRRRATRQTAPAR